MFSVVLIIHESCPAGVRALQIHKPASLVASKANQDIFNKIILVVKVDNTSKNPFIIYILYFTLKETGFLFFSRLVNLFPNSASEVLMNTASGSNGSLSAKPT